MVVVAWNMGRRDHVAAWAAPHDYQDDHIFVSEDPGGRVAGCEVADRRDLSDHSPLRLTLGEAPRAAHDRF